MTSDEWIAFSEWLGRDPRHAAAYDAVVAADGDLGLLLRSEPAVEPEEAPRSRVGLVVALVGSIAAALVAALFVWPAIQGPRFEQYATAREQRTIEVAQGITARMNAATRIAVSPGAAPVVRVEEGEVAFVIDRPEPSPLRVEVAGLTLVDRGTVFNVVRDSAGVRVAVAKGSILVDPDAQAITLAAGDTLAIAADTARAVKGRTEPEAILAWQHGRLSYSRARGDQVAADLTRNLGVRVEANAIVGQREFSGVIQLDGNPEQIVGEAAALLGGKAEQAGTGWRIVAQ